jgi:hypothetical protein
MVNKIKKERRRSMNATRHEPAARLIKINFGSFSSYDTFSLIQLPKDDIFYFEKAGLSNKRSKESK